ncbi:hypothetical protein G6O67_003766 [Ophiocordyceps sinensis]|uniref:Uncharacterized protein n=3 Tax=Ophiocordyceps sinensis TaxID=72228 RepID=A0A8H4V6C6_9HYPO|nr:hypothetical protein G6O67_003766 [Ophiocordyceps sinensis]
MSYIISPMRGVKVNRDDMTHEEAGWASRTDLEGGHRQKIYYAAVKNTYVPSMSADPRPRPMIAESDFLDTCNKSVPIFILHGDPYQRMALFTTILHIYIYRRWFRPYRSDIEGDRFICKFIIPRDLPDNSPTSQSNIDALLYLHGDLCTQVESCHSIYDQQLARTDDDISFQERLRLLTIRNHKFYVLQPLFRALLVVFSPADWSNEDSSAIGKVPVTIVRTGIEDGLSEPLTFEPIADKITSYLSHGAVRCSLETAIDFVMLLEAREAAAFGLNPDPAAVWKMMFDGRIYKTLRPTEPTIGPSSRFVDTSQITKWSGPGENWDSVLPRWEVYQFGREKQRLDSTDGGGDGAS